MRSRPQGVNHLFLDAKELFRKAEQSAHVPQRPPHKPEQRPRAAERPFPDPEQHPRKTETRPRPPERVPHAAETLPRQAERTFPDPETAFLRPERRFLRAERLIIRCLRCFRENHGKPAKQNTRAGIAKEVAQGMSTEETIPDPGKNLIATKVSLTFSCGIQAADFFRVGDELFGIGFKVARAGGVEVAVE